MNDSMLLVLEVGMGFLLGGGIMNAMPRIIPSRWLLGLSLAGIGIVAIIGMLVYPLHERMLVPAAVLAAYVVSAAAFRTREIRSQYSTDQLILLGLALLAVAVAGALLGYSVLAIVGGLGSAIVLVLAFVGAVMLANGFALILLFMGRGDPLSAGWRATTEAARMIDEAN